MAKVLVVGGAGYVGSAACAWLLDRGHQVWIIDDLSTGFRELVLSDNFTLAKAGDQNTVCNLLSNVKFDCVMHFAARSIVSESVQKPQEYFENNVNQTSALIDTMLENGVKKFIFSSTCAVFGDPGDKPIDETLEKKPINPYGETKLEVERMLSRLSKEKGLQSVALRYFNAAGAELGLRVGECHNPETHLIPNILNAIQNERPIQIFGGDYNTKDGTCVRDYIHVTDLANAHAAALDRLMSSTNSDGVFEAFNLGSEKGFSVTEVINECARITGKTPHINLQPRRPGDPARLVANSLLARKELGFKAGLSLESIISSAWSWEQKKLTPKRAVFLDRDGTLNPDPGYISSPDQISLFPGVGEALKMLKKAGYQLIIVSNQSGVGRGLIHESDVPLINERVNELLRPYGVKIDHFSLCFHTPIDNCECRKPKPKLVIDAAENFNIDLNQSYFIGDKLSDIETGIAAGCRASILVRTGEGKNTEQKVDRSKVGFIADDLEAAAGWIVGQET